MKLIDSIQWIQNGEKANSLVLNRSLKQLANIIDSNELNVTVSSSGMNIDVSSLGAGLQVGDFVTIRADGKYYPAGVDDTIIGIYALDGIQHSIKTGGIVQGTGFTVGSKYYLDAVTTGAITLNPLSGIQVGTAISSTELALLGGSGNTSGAGSSVRVPSSLLDSSVVENSFVYVGVDGKYYATVGGDNTKDAVIGVYQKGAINFSGAVELTSLVPGSSYYLSTTPGEITNIFYTNAVLVGIALSTTSLLLQIGLSTSTAGDTIASTKLLKSSFIGTEGQISINTNYNPDYLFVYSDGVLLGSDFYTATNGTSIVFATPLNAGETIQVSSLVLEKLVVGATTKASSTNIFTAIEGQTEFFLTYEVGAIDVYNSGMYASSVNYIADNGSSVIFNTPCTAGDEVVINTYSTVAVTGTTVTVTSIAEFDFDAIEGQTVFNTSYIVGRVSVYSNGIKLRSNEYIAIDGSSITLNLPCTANDWIQIVIW